MFGFGGLRAVSLFVHRSAMFVETVFIPNVDLKTSSTNIADLLTKKLTALSPVSEHFLCNNHNATDMQLIPLEFVKSNRDSVRKGREAYLIEKVQTLEPHGLNKKDDA